MLDATLRQRVHPILDRVAAGLDRAGLTPNVVTVIGLVVGIGACMAVAVDRWVLGLIMWLLNRLIDGLDGPLARRVGETQLGGFLDIMADFAIYGGIVVAIGWAEPAARIAALVVFLAYYLNGSAFLAWSSLAQSRMLAGDGRSLHFPAGLAEGTETIAAMSVVLLLREYTEQLLWAWAAIVGITVVQRIRFVAVSLADDPPFQGDPEPET